MRACRDSAATSPQDFPVPTISGGRPTPGVHRHQRRSVPRAYHPHCASTVLRMMQNRYKVEQPVSHAHCPCAPAAARHGHLSGCRSGSRRTLHRHTAGSMSLNSHRATVSVAWLLLVDISFARPKQQSPHCHRSGSAGARKAGGVQRLPGGQGGTKEGSLAAVPEARLAAVF